MIHKDTLTTDWIDQVSKENRKADKILVEKTIRALLLLEGLSQSDLPFIFKGGTALMMALNTPRRLSIDIDIILTEKHNNLEEQLSNIAKAKGFLRVELQHRTGATSIEKEHYKFMEIIKQLYDIGNAFDAAQDLEVIKSTYLTIVEIEMVYRGMKGRVTSDVLEDTYQTALCLSLRGTVEPDTFELLQKGIQRVAQFIFSETFQIEKAIVAASKAAYLTRLIAADQKAFEKYQGPHQIGEAVIGEPHNTKLNKLKKSNPEAFFYWWKATQLV